MNLLTIVLTAVTASAATVVAQLVALVAIVVALTTTLSAAFKIPEGAWKGWARRLVSWVISIGLVYLCYWLKPYGTWIPQVDVLFEPWWASCLVEGILLGGLSNGMWTQEWVQKICDFIENLFKKKEKKIEG